MLDIMNKCLRYIHIFNVLVCDVHVSDLGKYSKIVDDRAHRGRLVGGEWILESYGSQSFLRCCVQKKIVLDNKDEFTQYLVQCFINHSFL
jgi:hypothetical protein